MRETLYQETATQNYQDIRWTELFKITSNDGKKRIVRVSIKVDKSYAEQSYARSEVFDHNNNKWNYLGSRHWSKIQTTTRTENEKVIWSGISADKAYLLDEADAIFNY